MFIAIVDDGGNLMYLERMDDSQLASQEVSVQKARSALLFKRPTKALEDAVAGGRMVIMALANAVPVEGGLPLDGFRPDCGGDWNPRGRCDLPRKMGSSPKLGADELDKILSGKVETKFDRGVSIHSGDTLAWGLFSCRSENSAGDRR